MSYTRPPAGSASASWFGAAAYARLSAGAAGVQWQPDVIGGRIAASSPLGAPSVFAGVAVPIDALIAAPSPLGGGVVLAYHDFTALVAGATQYAMELRGPGGAIRVPISSWQATLQVGRKSYVQCVVPACSPWVSALDAAVEFVILRRAQSPSGGSIEYEMARAPLGVLQYSRGPQRYTATLSGYADGFASDESPPTVYDRTLVGVRSMSSTNGSLSVRCEIDWLLRPGHRAIVDSVPFVVSYINYYVNGNDSYCDVGGAV